MKVQIQAVNTEITENLEPYIQEKLDKLEKFYPKIVHAEVYLKKQEGNPDKEKIVEVEVYVPGPTIFASAKSKNYVNAMNEVTEQLRKQLIKKRELESDHRSK